LADNRQVARPRPISASTSAAGIPAMPKPPTDRRAVLMSATAAPAIHDPEH
jgi:hypothetical protein